MGKKKNFKGGLDGLLASSVEKPVQPVVVTENTSNTGNVENTEVQTDAPENIGILFERINLLKSELLLWRTGELTVEKFRDSLKKNGLYYSPEENKILKS